MLNLQAFRKGWGHCYLRSSKPLTAAPFVWNNNVTNVIVWVYATRNTAKQQVMNIEVVDQQLSDHGGILNAHPGEDNHNTVAFQISGREQVAINFVLTLLGGFCY